MLNINLLDPPGIQNKKGKNFAQNSSTPNIEKNIKKAEQNVAQIETDSSPQQPVQSKNKTVFKSILITLLSIAILIGGYILYNQYKSSVNNTIGIGKSEQQKSTGSKRSNSITNDKRTQVSPAYLSPKYVEKILSQQKNIIVTSQFLTSLPKTAQVRKINCAEGELSSITFFSTQQNGNGFKTRITEELPDINPLVFSLENTSNGPLPWKLVSLLDFSVSIDKTDQTDKFVHKSDENLSKIINIQLNKMDLKLDKFAISSADRDITRTARISGRGNFSNIGEFLRTFSQRNINFGVQEITIEDIPESNKNHFTILGKIFPKK